jgi:hypothetical protein
MNKYSKIIYLLLVLTLTFSASAGNMACCVDLHSDDKPLQIPIDKDNTNCHQNQDKSTDESLDNCCLSMGLCHSITISVSYSTIKSLQPARQSLLLPENNLYISRDSTPLTHPPKIIS